MDIAISITSGILCFLIIWAFLNISVFFAWRKYKKENAPMWVVLPIILLSLVLSLGFSVLVYFIYGWFAGSSDSAPTS